MCPSLSENARIVLEKRYLLRHEMGEISETPEELFFRVAEAVAFGDSAYGATRDEVDELTGVFYERMMRLEFMPNSPTLMNAGKRNGQLSACFVLPVPDSLEGIFDTLKHAALIHQSGGGTGFSFSRLRPEGDLLKFTSGVTSGPVSFMRVYNMATEAIKQGGTRRGANMGILRVDHPDIEAFIDIKNDLSELTNFNISVAVTDKFMDAVKANGMFDLVHPGTGEVVKQVPAKEIMDKIVQSAWRTGEPGLIFIDRINADHVLANSGELIESTNPCGEVPLLPYEACNLGSINLGAFIQQNVSNQTDINWPALAKCIEDGVHFLDNVITQNHYPLPVIADVVKRNRKIGLGLMGWADTLMKLGIPYNSQAALDLAEHVSAFLNYHSKWASVRLAKKRGRFESFGQSKYKQGNVLTQKYGDTENEGVTRAQWQELDAAIAEHGLRNATTVCLAPTGTISIIAGASGGIEPLYALIFMRNVMEGTQLKEANPIFAAALARHDLYSDDTLALVTEHGGVQDLPNFPDELKKIFVTAHDITPDWHIKMQAAFQAHCDNAVSKTINFPESAKPEEIEQAYQMAFAMNLKGITVYRNNSRLAQPMGHIKSTHSDNPLLATSGIKMVDGKHCPDCKKPLIKMEGCFQCPDCQYAYCG